MITIKHIVIGKRKIIIQGIGKMFFQDGFPISMAIDKFTNSGMEISILHVADECLKNNWSRETTLRKLTDEFNDDPNKQKWDQKLLSDFVFSSYEEQRHMLFDYLFKAQESESIEFMNFALDIEFNKKRPSK